MPEKIYKVAAEIGLYLTVGRLFVRQTIETALEVYGQYNADLVQSVEDEVLQHPDILESLLEQEWADAVVVEWDDSSVVNGTIDYEGEETELDIEDIRGLELVVEDFVLPFVEEAVDRAEHADLVWIPVEGSSNVSAFAYDPVGRFMYVEFLDKGQGAPVYQYDDVDVETYNAFLAAPSKGKAVWQLLRDRFDYHRLQ